MGNLSSSQHSLNFQIEQRTHAIVVRFSEKLAYSVSVERSTVRIAAASRSVVDFIRAVSEANDTMPHNIYYSDKYYDDQYEYR